MLLAFSSIDPYVMPAAAAGSAPKMYESKPMARIFSVAEGPRVGELKLLVSMSNVMGIENRSEPIGGPIAINTKA